MPGNKATQQDTADDRYRPIMEGYQPGALLYRGAEPTSTATEPPPVPKGGSSASKPSAPSMRKK